MARKKTTQQQKPILTQISKPTQKGCLQQPQDQKVIQINRQTIKPSDLKLVIPSTQNQELIFDEYSKGKSLFIHGFPGTGKTFISMYLALKEVLDSNNPYDKLLIVRSAVAARDLGFLPGTLEEKIYAYELAYKSICQELLPNIPNAYDRLVEQKKIEDDLGVKMYSPEYDAYIDDLKIKITDEVIVWNLDLVDDLLRYLYASQILKTEFAKNDIEAKDPMVNQKFLLVKDGEDVKLNMQKIQKINSAVMFLENMYQKDKEKLVIMAKYLLPINTTLGISVETAYMELDKYIKNNTMFNQDPEDIFLKAVETDEELINVTVIFKEALTKNVIRKSVATNEYIEVMTNTPLGKTEQQVVENLMSPDFSDILGFGLDSDAPTSIRRQIMSKK